MGLKTTVLHLYQKQLYTAYYICKHFLYNCKNEICIVQKSKNANNQESKYAALANKL